MTTRIKKPTPPLALRDCYVLYANGCAWGKRTAYDAKKPMKLGLLLPRSLGAVSVRVSFSAAHSEALIESELSWSDAYREYDLYELSLDKKIFKPDLYFFNFTVESICGVLYINRTESNKGLPSCKSGNAFQLTVSRYNQKLHRSFFGGIIYQIFVDRFSRGQGIINVDGAIYPESFDVIPEVPEYPGAPLKNNTFWGGNLYGIIDRLDYLKSLSVTAIYLTPIFKSPSNHKYDTADYMQVDEGFGGDKALKELIDKAHQKGIKIILDGVFNHTGADSIYFNKYGTYGSSGAYNTKESPYYSWYDFKNYPNDYTSWWGIEILPRINPDIKECAEFFTGSDGVIEKYTKMGIDGFRLDVVDELSDTFIKTIKAKQVANNPDSILYGEVWEDASNKISYDKRKAYYLGEELDGVMNYPLKRGIIDYIKNGNTDALSYALDDVYNNAPERVANLQMNLLGSHDTERILTALGGVSPDGYTNRELSVMKMSQEERSLAKNRLILAYTIVSTLPGIPMIYYADEAGLEGYSDPCNRLPFPYGKEDNELIREYQKLGRVRTKNHVFNRGNFEILHLDFEIIAFRRYTRGCKNSTVTLINRSLSNYSLSFSDQPTVLYSTGKSIDHLEPLGAKIIKLTNECMFEFSKTTI